MKRALLIALAGISLCAAASAGDSPPPAALSPAPAPAASEPKGAFLLTVFLKHDQSKPLEEINAELKRQGFYKAFPPPGIEVVSWYVMMGIGQVVTLRVPAERLREVNRCRRGDGVGRLPDRVLPDLRPQSLRRATARRGAVSGSSGDPGVDAARLPDE